MTEYAIGRREAGSCRAFLLEVFCVQERVFGLKERDEYMTFSLKRVVKTYPFFICGFIPLIALGALYIANGDHIPVVVHDQLDGEVLCYKMAADHLGSTFYPEFMGGQAAITLPLSIPGMFIFYLLFPPAMAFAVNLACVIIVAYASLYASLHMLEVRDSVAAFTGMMFALLPFYSVYSIAVMGMPLLLCALLVCFREGKMLFPILAFLLYAAFSSLVWVGFAVCFILLLITAYFAVRRNWKNSLRGGVLLLALAGAYVAFNIDLLTSALAPSVVGHRSEFVFAVSTLSLEELSDHFFQGHYHCVSNHYYLAVFDIAAVIFGGVYLANHLNQNDGGIRRLFLQVVAGLLVALIIALFWLFYLSEIGSAFRSYLPESLRTLQLERFNWLYPCVWYVTSGLAFELIVRIGAARGTTILSWLALLFVLALTLNISAKGNVVLLNAKEMITGRDSSQITWTEFYAEDLFEEIKADMDGLGENQRVLSVGLHPSVALYNGLSTIDGYSVNYPLSYKHAFAQIIEGELEKSDSLYTYFWDWGSRCYAFSHELGRQYVFPKDSGISLKEFSMNTGAMKEMGADYVISAVPIERASEHGLELVGEYRTEESYYELWLYRIAGTVNNLAHFDPTTLCASA